MKDNMKAMSELLPELSVVAQNHHTEKVLFEQIQTLKRTLHELDGNVSARLAIENKKLSENQRLRWVASSFLSDIDNLIEDVQLSLRSRFNEDLPNSGIVTNNFSENAITAIST